jgi:mannosyl-3-phosphoglycerate phosphatase
MMGVGLVVSDLDGTLLDRETYGYTPALPALAALRTARVPLVLVTAKTRAEMATLGPALGAAAVIVENGGAVEAGGEAFSSVCLGGPWRRESGRWRLVLGASRETLLAALPEVARAAGVAVRPFAAMSVDEVASLTGLGPEAAALAMRREHDEPFLVEGAAGRDTSLDARLDRAARDRGLRVTHGGWLHHLTGPADKGDAMRALLEAWPDGREGEVVGLGDAANDLPLLLAVDRPILMPQADGSLDPALAARFRGAERAPLAGPAGWAAAVLGALRGETLPRVAR